jgi:hypothetical protein
MLMRSPLLTRRPFSRVANVMRQSGCEVPEWMLAYVHEQPALAFLKAFTH